MRHKKHADKRLAGGEPHGRAPPGLPPQPPQHPGQQRRQHKILHDAHAGVGHQAQKRPQPDQIPVPVARVGERLEGIGQRRARLPRGEISREVVGQRLEIVDIVGGVGHHGGQRGGLVGAGGLEQHDRVGVVVHLEQFKTEKLRVQPFALQRGRSSARCFCRTGAPGSAYAPSSSRNSTAQLVKNASAARARNAGAETLRGCISRFTLLVVRMPKSIQRIQNTKKVYHDLPRQTSENDVTVRLKRRRPGARPTGRCPSRRAASSGWCRRRKKTAG